jgi:hypothetical protein
MSIATPYSLGGLRTLVSAIAAVHGFAVDTAIVRREINSNRTARDQSSISTHYGAVPFPMNDPSSELIIPLNPLLLPFALAP